jgi:hypothetical protein
MRAYGIVGLADGLYLLADPVQKRLDNPFIQPVTDIVGAKFLEKKKKILFLQFSHHLLPFLKRK